MMCLMKRIFIPIISIVFLCFSCPDSKPTKVVSKGEPEKLYPGVEDIVKKLKGKLTSFNVEIDPYSRVSHTVKPAHVISLYFKDTVVLPFNVEEYYFQDGSLNLSGGDRKELLNKVITLIDSTYHSNDKMFDILRGAKLTLQGGKGVFSASMEINIGDYFADLAITLKNLYYTKYKTLKIYVLGAADVSKKPWDGQQKERYGIFDSVLVHPAAVSKTNFRVFEERLVPRYFGITYYNNDLPNLRAAYVQEVIKQMLNNKKKIYEKYSVEVLDGAEIGEEVNEKYRRAEIMIELYD